MGRDPGHSGGRNMSTGIGRIARTATAMTVAAATVVALSGGQQSSRAADASAIASYPYEVAAIADTSFPIPIGALFVSDGGSDANPGSLGAPFATIRRALAAAPTGGTIVLRGGVYRESLGTISRRVTIQAYPYEQPWLKGSALAASF